MEPRPASSPISARQDWWWIFDPRCSLRARAALLVGGATVVATLFASNVTGRLYRRSLEAAAGAHFETLAVQMSDKIDRTLYERYRTLTLAADLAPIRGEGVAVADRRRLLESVQVATPDFAWIGLTDVSGRIVAATNRLFEGTEAGTRPWFRGAREYPHIGALHEFTELTRALPPADDGSSQTRFLDLAVPVTGPDGQFAGVLAAHVRWNWTHAVQLSVVTEAAARERIGVTVYGATGDVLLDSGVSGWTQPPEPPAMGEGRRHRGYLIENAAGGSTYLTGYMRSRGFRDYRGLSWLTVVRQPAERVFASVTQLERAIAIWGFTLALVATCVSWMIAGRHARRLRSVALAADRIRAGDVLAVLPRPKGEGETAIMCGALSDLVEDLRAERETLTTENDRLAAQARDGAAPRR